MQNKRTFVILTPAFPENESDTNWVPSQQLFVRKLKKNFPDLSIIVLSFLHPLPDEYSWHGVKVISFGGLNQRKLKRLFLWNRIMKKLKQIKREHDIAGIFSFWCGECAMIGKRFAKKNQVEHYCWISGMDARKDNRFIKYIRPQSSELIAMSEFLSNEFYKNHGVLPAHIIPNAIDPDSFPPPAKEKDIDILSAGTLIPLKQYDKLIPVIKSLSVEYPNIKAIHCGFGSEEEKLKAEVKRERLENNISFIGLQPHEEVLKLLGRSKIFLHPSAYEGYSTVCLEALYGGAQVISFCGPGGNPVPDWHIVNTTEEMIRKASEILKNPISKKKPVLLHSMDDSVKLIMALYNHGNTEKNN